MYSPEDDSKENFGKHYFGTADIYYIHCISSSQQVSLPQLDVVNIKSFFN